MSEPLSQESVDEITDALFAGRKIDAIRIYREATGQGLYESKQFVDAIEVRLREQSPEKFSNPQGSGCVVWLLVAMLVIVAVAVFVVL